VVVLPFTNLKNLALQKKVPIYQELKKMYKINKNSIKENQVRLVALNQGLKSNAVSDEMKDILYNQVNGFFNSMRIREVRVHEYNVDMFANNPNNYDNQIKNSPEYSMFIKFVNVKFNNSQRRRRWSKAIGLYRP
jgi:hypothetical protein